MDGWIKTGVADQSLKCFDCKLISSYTSRHQENIHDHFNRYYLEDGVYQTQHCIISKLNQAKTKDIFERAQAELNLNTSQAWCKCQSSEISQLRFPIEYKLERYMYLEKSQQNTQLIVFKEEQDKKIEDVLLKFKKLFSSGAFCLYIKSCHSILRNAFRNGKIRFKDYFYASIRLYMGQTSNIEVRSSQQNSSSAVSINLVVFEDCSKIDSIFLESIIYKLANSENIKIYRPKYRNSPPTIIKPSKFTVDDHKYLAIAMFKNGFDQLIKIIEEQSPLVQFLTYEDIPLSQPSLKESCRECNIYEPSQLLQSCGICKGNWHLNCIDESAGTDNLIQNWTCDNCIEKIKDEFEDEEEDDEEEDDEEEDDEEEDDEEEVEEEENGDDEEEGDKDDQKRLNQICAVNGCTLKFTYGSEKYAEHLFYHRTSLMLADLLTSKECILCDYVSPGCNITRHIKSHSGFKGKVKNSRSVYFKE